MTTSFLVLLYSLFFNSINSYIQFPIGSPIQARFKNNEVHKKIKLNLPEEQLNIVKKINGFYGLIGPDIKVSEIKNLYHFLLGDGIIQGCFFHNGELTFTRKYVKTEKLLYEDRNGKIPHNKFIHMIFHLLNKFKLLPNIFGLANTAIVNIKNKYYALYERDMPYELNVDFLTKRIDTIKRIEIPGLERFSGHSIISKNDCDNCNMNHDCNHRVEQTVETIDYSIIKNHFIYSQLNSDLKLQKRITVNTRYFPVIHDFLSTKDNIIFIDSPLFIDLPSLFKKDMPVALMKNKPTFIHIVDKETGRLTHYNSSESFYIFHYGDYKEDDYEINIYAPLYDNIDFSSMDIQGRYRNIKINKLSGTVTIIKSNELENLDMDFPVKFEDKVILRNVKNKISDGFTICRGLDVVHKIHLDNRFICGEPKVLQIDEVPYLISYAHHLYHNKQGFVELINLRNYNKIEIPIDTELYYGFHSIWNKKTY